MRASIIAIGDEVVNGFVVDTNSAFIARRLFERGIDVGMRFQVPDKKERIRWALKISLERSDIVIVTGGLGPTKDDITTCVVADYLGLNRIDLGIGYYIIQGAEIIENNVGVVPGMLIKKGKKLLFLMPGVPREMEDVFLKFLETLPKEKREIMFLRTCGLKEVYINEELGRLLNDTIGYHLYPSWRGVDILIETDDNKIKEKIYSVMGDYIYTEEEKEIEEVVGKLLKDKLLTISTAESCTGGLVSDLLTNVPGSSNYIMGGIVAYSNEAKMNLLKVKENSLKKYGAVSKIVAEEMAIGASKVFKTDIGISTTGIAGPTGERPGKPIGLVYMGMCIKGEVFVEKKIFKSPRRRVKIASATHLLFMLYRRLKA